MQCNRRPAIVLTSGGLDSTTCLAIARQQGFQPLYSLSFDYGQRHRKELDAAYIIAETYKVAEHRVITIDLRQFGNSALTDMIDVPKDRIATKSEYRNPKSETNSKSKIQNPKSEIPITYVPARNTIFLSYALAWAEVLNLHDIFIGVNAIDYSGYPDCRPAFIAAFEAMANLATKMTTADGQQIKIHTPLIHLSKAQIIRRGVDLGVDYSFTRSCYDPDDQGRACGRCDSCLLRKKGFDEAGVEDPTKYTP